MEKYKMFKELGDGTCGRVYKAIDQETSEIVAIKKMKRKFYVWEECVNLREVKSLRRLNHPNIIKLKEIIRENNELFFIFEYMEYNLYQIMRDRKHPFSEKEIRDFMYQVLQGLAHMHKSGYFHRDLKPENLLVTNQTIKMADFGLAREVSSMPPFTEYVSTRWYRAPEVLLQSPFYTPSVDMWAVGAILAELFTLYPIFPGDSEIDQLYKICCVLGKPDWTAFPEAKNIFSLVNICQSEIVPPNLSEIIPDASPEAIDLIKQLCAWDPLKRPTADECLRHPFFQEKTIPRTFEDDPLQLKLNSLVEPTPDLELKLWGDFGNNHQQQTDDCFLGLTLAINPIGIVHNKLPDTDFEDKSQSSDHNHNNVMLESSLSLSFSSNLNDSSPVGIGIGMEIAPQTSGFNMASSSSSSLWPNCLEHHHHPWLAMSSCSNFPAQLSPLKSNGDY